jgi:hypothetical protein
MATTLNIYFAYSLMVIIKEPLGTPEFSWELIVQISSHFICQQLKMDTVRNLEVVYDKFNKMGFSVSRNYAH